jgi:dTDP-4-dehydrorhamnose reductase
MILGVTGMLGSTALRLLSRSGAHETIGVARDPLAGRWFPDVPAARMVTGIDVSDAAQLAATIAAHRPEVLINAVGVIKQVEAAVDPLVAIRINAELPHRLARLCGEVGARLIHVSTDCVFSGRRGRYRESDPPDVTDLYGLSKYLGEVDDPHAITLRTSIIGPELATRHGLLEWFLAQRGPVSGFTRAIYSGLTSAELTRVIETQVITAPALCGLYHVAASPISKRDLLALIASAYAHPVAIEPVAEPAIDRSLDGGRFRAATGYVAPTWPELIGRMRALDGRVRQ